MQLLLYMYIQREKEKEHARHLHTPAGHDPQEIPALPRASACVDAPNESRAHTGASRVTWAGPGQVVIRQVRQVG